MENFNIEPKFIKDGLTRFDKGKLFVKSKENDNNLQTFESVFLDTVTIMRENNKESNFDINLFGGAGRPSKKKEITTYKAKSVFDINKIATEILDELIKDKFNFGLIASDDNKLMQFITNFMSKHSYNLVNSEYEYIIRFLRDNIYKILRQNVMLKHSLAAISEYGMTNNLLIKPLDSISCGSIQFEQKVAITKEVSNKWTGLSGLDEFSGKIPMSENIIDPLFVILFALKLPGIEDLVIKSDYQSLVNQIRNKEIQRYNTFLFLLRMIDTELLNTTDKNYSSLFGNETLRISISMLLREIAYNVRRGVFEDKASCFLVELLNTIKMPTAKFREENMLQAILATFSFKPTLITNTISTSKIALFGNVSQSFVFEKPKSVYTIEYPLSNMYCFSNNNIPRLGQSNFDLLGYDPTTQKVVFTYSDNNNIIEEDKNNLLQNLLTVLSTNKIEADINNTVPLIIARQPTIDSFYKNLKQVQILLTNGMYVVVNREQNNFNTCPTSNIFFRSEFKPVINISRILIETNVVVNKISYELVGALCYDIMEDDTPLFGNPTFSNAMSYVDVSLKLGTFALIKSDDKWYEYNPQDTITLDRKKNKIEKVLLNRYKKTLMRQDIPFDPASFNVWKTYNNNQEKIIQDVIENKITINDLIIDESEAMDKISTRACILFYAENYDVYQARIFEKCF